MLKLNEDCLNVGQGRELSATGEHTGSAHGWCRCHRTPLLIGLPCSRCFPCLYCDQKVSLGPGSIIVRAASNLSDQVNHHIVQSEFEGGVFLTDLPSATVLQIQTQHHCYTAVLLNEGSALISGHPQCCPQPVLVAIAGSTWGGSMLKRRFVGRGMRLEFCHPEYRTPIITSPIKEIRECPQLSQSEITALA